MKEHKIKNINEFLNVIDNLTFKNECYYRGESQIYEKYCTPSIFRENQDKEKEIVDLVYNERFSSFKNVEGNIDILLTMQHAGITTRLLDVTRNPFIALYFACENKTEDGVVYCFDSSKLDKKYPNSDTIAIVSSLSRMTKKEQELLFDISFLFQISEILLLKNISDYGYLESDVYEELLRYLSSPLQKVFNELKMEFSLNEVVEIDETLENRIIRFTKSIDEESLSQSRGTLYYEVIDVIEKLDDREKVNSFYSSGIPIAINNKWKEEVLKENRLFFDAYKEVYLNRVFNNLYAGEGDLDYLTEFKSKINSELMLLRKNFNNIDIVKKLLHEVRNFKAGFINNLLPTDLLKNYLVYPRYSNKRIINQNGAFILNGLFTKNEEPKLRITIPKNSKEEIQLRLNQLNINNNFIYPELENYKFK